MWLVILMTRIPHPLLLTNTQVSRDFKNLENFNCLERDNQEHF